MAASEGPINFRTSRFSYDFMFGPVHVYVYESSIVDITDVDCIVNSVNEQMIFTTGVALDIKAEAGERYVEECKSYVSSHGPLNFTEVFTLKALLRGSIRVMLAYCGCPSMSPQSIEDNLFKTIMNILKEAANQRFDRIAIPGIGAGKKGFPIDQCARVYVRAVHEFAFSVHEGLSGIVKEVHYVDVNAEILEEIRAAHKKLNPMENLSRPRIMRNRSEFQVFQLSRTLIAKICNKSLDTIERMDAVACRIDTSFKGGVVSTLLLTMGGKGYQNALDNLRRSTPMVHDGDVLVLKADVRIASHVLLCVFKEQHTLMNKVEMDKLKSLYHNIFQTSRQKKFRGIAMPLIGLGMQWDYGRIEDIGRTLVEVLTHASKQGSEMLEITIADKASVVTDSLKQMLGSRP
ncbi:hypothetical protein CHS0354_041348 [Potamilus streckersoni]|uniref:Macro domain-containing protein n=1 Tax=Potamilus streckersoni TaxID=2493646 RepID=A0AAE0SE12_9BIVA|nr:hypothetical protein CHS0354_041348 [Potamilus streckersoni]